MKDEKLFFTDEQKEALSKGIMAIKFSSGLTKKQKRFLEGLFKNLKYENIYLYYDGKTIIDKWY